MLDLTLALMTDHGSGVDTTALRRESSLMNTTADLQLPEFDPETFDSSTVSVGFDLEEEDIAIRGNFATSDGDGVLETWCVWDTGEDGCTRLVTRGAPSRWPFDKPPGAAGMPTPRDSGKRYWFYPSEDGRMPSLDEVRVPFASMDVMAYRYSGRSVLAKVARFDQPGKVLVGRGEHPDVHR